MDGRCGRNEKRRREQRWSRILLVVAVLVFFGGLFGQIAMRDRIADQTKKIDKVDGEIVALDANVKNLTLCINQYHNLEQIDERARALGMYEPTEEELRVVRLHSASGNTSTQTVASSAGEEING